MDKFKSELRMRIIAMRLYALAVAALLIMDVYSVIGYKDSNALSFTLGACAGTLVLAVFFLRRYALAMRDEESIKRLYIVENDERRKVIASKTGGAAINIVVLGLILAAVIAGFFSDVVSFSLFGGALYASLVKGTLKVYYNRSF